MKKKIPGYIIHDCEHLETYLNKVAKIANEIEAWVSANTDADGCDFFLDNHLDNPYEYRADYTMEQLKRLVEE